MTRRSFITRTFLAFCGVVAGECILDTQRPCIVNRKTITLRGLPAAFDGIRIALLSDFHHGTLVPASTLRDAVRLANSLAPDLIALTGDFIDRGKEWVEPCFRELSALRAPLGVFGVLGNHDHYKGAGQISRHGLIQAGITDLTNSGINLYRNGQALRICGVGDLWHERQNLRAALGTCRVAESAILLSHNPDYAEQIRDDRIGLMLSGHTHGGQCVLPWIGAPFLPSHYGQKYISGLCHGPLTKVFVTTGVGYTGLPIRFNCPAEVALLTLKVHKT